MKTIGLFLNLLLLMGSCKEADSVDNITVDFSSLEANSFVMKVERIAAAPEIQFPADEIEEEHYVSFNDEKLYNISFSEDAQAVNIEPGAIEGVQMKDDMQKITYKLIGGVGAGGRFVVWKEKEKFEGELTIYGSGVPIIQSERGALRK